MIKLAKHITFQSVLILIFLASLSSKYESKEEYKFLFLGHTYDWSSFEGNAVDDRVEKLAHSGRYDGFWLGGDICANTSLDPKTMEYLDGLFDLKNPNSHFAIGNHDYRDNNPSCYFEATGRPDYYTSTFKNLTVSVINSNINSSDCENLNAQYRMLKNVCDSLQQASHYLIIMHHQIFTGIKGTEAFKSHGDLKHYSMNCDSSTSYFNRTIYPELIKLEERDIEVIVLIGDTGWHKGSEATCSKGVTYLASGINNSHYKGKPLTHDLYEDHVLEFKLIPRARTLTWEFIKLNELTGSDQREWLKK